MTNAVSILLRALDIVSPAYTASALVATDTTALYLCPWLACLRDMCDMWVLRKKMEEDEN